MHKTQSPLTSTKPKKEKEKRNKKERSKVLQKKKK
jgi:hypothetical protein